MTELTEIRVATLADAPSVKRLIDELENTVSDPLIFESIYTEYCVNPDTLMFVLELESLGIKGFVSCKGQRLLHHQGLVFEIQEMIVGAGQQGKGYGRLLFEIVQQEVVARGAKSLEVTSNKRRKEAHAFYESMGFRNSHEKFTIYF
ncbi:GNAT family N-acetyltransferase [Aquirufa regiilacus]